MRPVHKKIGEAKSAETNHAPMAARNHLLYESGIWRHEAKCRNTGPSYFFPIGMTGPALDKIAEAKKVCADCSVSEMCLEFALATNQDSGVWGGHSEEERREMRRARAKAKRLAAAKAAKQAIKAGRATRASQSNRASQSTEARKKRSA